MNAIFEGHKGDITKPSFEFNMCLCNWYEPLALAASYAANASRNMLLLVGSIVMSDGEGVTLG